MKVHPRTCEHCYLYRATGAAIGDCMFNPPVAQLVPIQNVIGEHGLTRLGVRPPVAAHEYCEHYAVAYSEDGRDLRPRAPEPAAPARVLAS